MSVACLIALVFACLISTASSSLCEICKACRMNLMELGPLRVIAPWVRWHFL